jgi:hypothetical protein
LLDVALGKGFEAALGADGGVDDLTLGHSDSLKAQPPHPVRRDGLRMVGAVEAHEPTIYLRRKAERKYRPTPSCRRTY